MATHAEHGGYGDSPHGGVGRIVQIALLLIGLLLVLGLDVAFWSALFSQS